MAMAKKKNDSTPVQATVTEKRFSWQFPIVKLRYWWFAISLLIIIPGIISLFMHGINQGIDFKGGSVFDINFSKQVSQGQISTALESIKLGDSQVQMTDATRSLIKTKALDETERDTLIKTLEEKVAPFDHSSLKEDKVGPTIGNELKWDAITALAIAAVGMIIYLSIRFEFLYGISAIIAIIHDVLVVLGLFSIFQWEIDSSFVAAILTVVGYSINDTVVIFDRIRENSEKLKRGDSYEEMVERSVWQTMGRSIYTVVTVLIMLFAIFLLGGESTRIFSLAMLIGVFSGAYSSIFNASQILVEFKLWQERRTKNIRLGKSRA
ncbi:MAG TPA: protein translocase subunit SecF [Candidatus Deferrimicrobium sp.]|nr:protein translocase subunit SecF [Candidatus Deferrimicrobium sp.]